MSTSHQAGAGAVSQAEGLTLREFTRVLQRRRRTIALVGALVPLSAVVFSLQQRELYRASAEVLIGRQDLAAAVTDTRDPTASQQPERVAETQARLARVPQVAAATLNAVGIADRTPQAFLDSSTVSAATDADLLEFDVTDSGAALASRLATEYAQQFTRYRRELDTAAIRRARSEARRTIAGLERSGERRSRLYSALVEKDQELATLEALRTSNASVVQAAGQARQIRPQLVRSAAFGVGLGLVLAIGLAFTLDALDTRVRTAGEIGERLGLPLLGRLPEPPKRLRTENPLTMLGDPDGVEAEAYRVLRTNLQFANLEREAKTIMMTSAIEGEGKSTTLANLGVALARTRTRVILVDLDLRRPSLKQFFALNDAPGLTQVALGHAGLDDALAPVAIPEPEGSAVDAGNADARDQGMLEVLPAGMTPPDPGEFVTSQALAKILAQLQRRADLVLIDAPPLLHVGDAVALSGKVDALLLVARLNVVRRPILSEVRRVLDTCPAEKLGFVLTGAELEEGYGYFPHYHAYAPDRAEKEPVA